MNKKIRQIVIMFISAFIIMGNVQIKTQAYDGNTITTHETGYHHTGQAFGPNGDTAWFNNQDISAIYANDEPGVCTEPWTLAGDGTSYTGSAEENKRLSDIWYYAWEMSAKTNWDRAVWQLMTWEEYNYFPQHDVNGYSDRKSEIETSISNHGTLPSWSGESIVLKLGESATLTDTNNALGEFELATNSSNVSYSLNGNDITITANENSEDGTLVFRKVKNSSVGPSIVYSSDRGEQQVTVSRMRDPKYYDLNIEILKYGQLDLFKKDEDENAVEGIGFDIVNKTTGDVQSAVTDANGKINLDLLPDDYTAYETTTLPHLVLDSTPQEFTIKPNETTSLDFTNKWVVGNSEIAKVDSNGNIIKVAGAEYDVFSPTGDFLEHIIGGADGKAITKYYRYADGYKYIETKAPYGFIPDSTPVYFNIRENMQTVTVEKENKRAVGHIVLDKEDRETGKESQAEANMIGAGFSLIANVDLFDPADQKTVVVAKGTNLGEKIMGEDLKLEWKDLYLSDEPNAYKLVETTVPLGYEKADDVFVNLKYKDNATAVVKVDTKVKEDVIKNKFKITKIIGDNLSGVVKFEEGAEFDVQLERDILAVGIENAKKYDTLITDANGEAESKMLPFAGVLGYRVTQTKAGNENLELAPSFNVKIDSSTVPTKHYVINNQLFTAYPKFEKLLTNTGETITLNGAKVKIWDKQTNGYYFEQVGKHRVTEWTTDEEGSVMTNREMPAGKYELIEIEAPDGTNLRGESLPFEITSSKVHEINEDGKAIQIIRFGNDAPVGKIIVNKTHEAYDTAEPKSAGFKVWNSGKDAIVSPATGKTILEVGQQWLNHDSEDGLWYTEDGKLEVADLPMSLGNAQYSAQEMATNEEYVVEDTVYTFDFVKDGDTTLVYEKSVDIENKLKRTDLVVNKIDEYTRGKLEDYSNIELTLFKDEELTDVFAKVKVDQVTGQAIFKDIIYGSHLFLGETSTNSKYYLNGQVIELVFDNDLEGIGETHTMDYANKPIPTMTTLATGDNAKKTLDRNVDNKLTDTVSIKNIDIKEEYDLYTYFYNYATGKVELSATNKGITFDKKDVDYKVELLAKAHTLKGDRYYFGQQLFLAGADIEKDEPIVEHMDKEDLGQTIRFTTSEIGTLATGINGEKELDPTVDNEVVDVIKYKGIDTNKTYDIKTLGVNTAVIEAIAKDAGKKYSELSDKEVKESLAKVLLANPSLVLINQTEKNVKFDKSNGEYTVKATLKANTLKDGEGIVFFEYFTDTDLIKPVEPGKPTEPVIPTVEHEVPTEPGQTIKMKNKEYEIQVNKVDSSTNKPIVNSKFVFTFKAYKDGELVKEVDINGDENTGIATFKFTGEGSFDKFDIVENDAPDGYVLSKEVKEVTMKDFDENNIYSFVYNNDRMPRRVVTGVDTQNTIILGLSLVGAGVMIVLFIKSKKKRK